MNVTEIVLSAIEEVVGIDSDELREEPDLELMTEGILDSLSLAMVLAAIESRLGRQLHLRQMDPDSFSTVNKLVAAVEGEL